MNTTISVRHNFETAHRLPDLGGKCVNLHGHSWWCEITLAPTEPGADMVLEYGTAKRIIRRWIDEYLDHGAMLGDADPLADFLESLGSKVYRFGVDNRTSDQWPTVESVARMLHTTTTELFRDLPARVVSVRVNETHVNSATSTTPPTLDDLPRVRIERPEGTS